jgi:putative salt-induced outer membrane protein YdiY
MTRWYFMAVVVCGLAGAARADEVLLTDGSKIVGQVEQLADGKIKVMTQFAGELTIDASKVQSITTAKPMAVQLKDGERVIGNLSVTPEGMQQVVRANATTMPVPVPQVTNIWAPEQDSPEVAALKAKVNAKLWSFHAEVGLDGQTGNSEIINFNARAHAIYQTDADMMRLYVLGRYSRNNGVGSAQQELGGIDLEHNFAHSNWFAFGNVELENNRYTDVALRTSIAGGAGYHIVRDEDLTFDVRGGPGFEHDSYYNGAPSKDTAIAELGEFLHWKAEPWISFEHNIVYYPTLRELSDYRIVMENGAVIPISKDKMWNLHLGVRNEYVSQPVLNFKRLDTFYFLNLGVDF